MSAEQVIEQILRQRGIGAGDREQFLGPDFEHDTHAPELMLGMGVAVDRLVTAVAESEQVVVFGDYDADGVPATALLTRGLRALGLTVTSIIPTRSSGYGLSAAVVEQITATGTRLLITVDNGTVAKEEIAALNEAGVAVIVCDHHQPLEGQLAPALAILNPKQPDCPYPFKELCGCAIAWKLLWSLYATVGRDPASLKWELDLVALSTVADMVPLVGENRVLVQFGLKVMRKSRNQGLQALVAAAGLQLAAVGPGDIGFRLGPRINAPSRMHQDTVAGQNPSLALLLSEQPAEAESWAEHLSTCNTARQDLLERQVREAVEEAEHYLPDMCLVLYRPDWSSGVIGLLAGRLLERYRRPVVVLAPEEGEVKGSVRSVEGVGVVELLDSACELFSRFGGHAKAGGLTLAGGESVVPVLRARLNHHLREQGVTLEQLALAMKRTPDLELSLSEADLPLAEALQQLEPFGIGFPEPIFRTTATLIAPRGVGREGKHLSCFLDQAGVRRKAIGFGLAAESFQSGDQVQVDFTLQAEEYRGVRSASCCIQSMVLV